MARSSTIKRKTKETNIQIELKIDGQGRADVSTGIPFLDHMLDLLAKHGLFDLEIQATGDLEVDAHHTVEDIGICLGQAFRAGLKDKKGIRRFGYSLVPMDEALAMTSIDISGRPHLFLEADIPAEYIGNFDTSLVIEFFHAFVNHFAVTLHMKLLAGRNAHHCIEAIFKGLAKAIDMATQIDSRIEDVPSTKGQI